MVAVRVVVKDAWKVVPMASSWVEWRVEWLVVMSVASMVAWSAVWMVHVWVDGRVDPMVEWGGRMAGYSAHT